MSFRLTPGAEADITAIALYIAEDNPAAAVRWYGEMLRHCRNLGEKPELGVARPEVRPDLRTFPAGNYMILYRKDLEGVEIVRIVHGARQWQKLLD